MMAGVLVLACEQAALDGVAHVLSNFYLAVVGRWHMRFLDPGAQARFDALREALEGLSLADAERALAEGRVADRATGVRVRYEPALAVMAVLPAVLSGMTKDLVPATNAALAGNVALVSPEVMAMASLVLIKFQLASTALTVTLNALPAVCAFGVPVLPVGEPGNALSPGVRS